MATRKPSAYTAATSMASGDKFVMIPAGGGNLASATKSQASLNINAKGANIASAATTDLSTATGDWVDVTGTTTITAFGTVAAGMQVLVRFTGILTLTHNGTSLILPGSMNITTAANDFAVMRSLGSGNWICTRYAKAAGADLKINVKGADLASAATTDLSTATGRWVDITGSTTITALGTASVGTEVLVRFTGILTLTHNGTSLILPGAANITTAANDFAVMCSLGSGNWICVRYSRASIVSTPTDVQVFTSTGANTWNKPANAKAVRVTLIGGGGGGGSGRKGLSGSDRFGGGSGSGGCKSTTMLSAALLGSSETVTVGAGGAGGNAQSTDSTNGNNGIAGGATSFGSWLVAGGGPLGSGGTAVGGIGGAASGGQFVGGTGANSSVSGNPIGSNNTTDAASGGAPGGGISSGDVIRNGGAGANRPASVTGTILTIGGGGTAGTGAGGAGGNGTGASANQPSGGAGGGGGAASRTGGTPGGAGGNGGIYGGGGGGGGAGEDAATVNTNSGAGGNGANGIAVVVTFF